jgi:spore maturation protein CgeB
MRVGVIGPTEADTFADNIFHTLPKLGVEPVALGPAAVRPGNKVLGLATQWARRQSAETEEWFQRPLVHRAQDSDCDVILNVEQSLMPATVKKLKKGGRRIALWFPDAISNIARMAMIAADYDALYIKDPLLAQRLATIYGLPAIYMPEACNPDWHYPVGESGGDPFIVVVGNLYPSRARLLTRLYEEGVPLRLYGTDFPRWYDPGALAGLFTRSFVTRAEKSRVFRRSRGVLNNLHPAEMNSVNARLFEAAAAGGAVLCEYRDSLGDLFRVGEEVLAFSTFGELITQCYALLADASFTKRVGDAASRRALLDHTYEIRLSAILNDVM